MQNGIVAAVLIAAATFILQKTLGNLISGIVLLITKPFKVGDKIVIKNQVGELVSGKVASISLLYVKVLIYNRDVTIISTSQLDNYVIVNSDYKEGTNHSEYLRFTIDSDHRKAVEIIRNYLIESDMTKNKKENTNVVCKFDNGYIIIRYNVRTNSVDESFVVCSDICQDLIDIFKKTEGVTLA